MKYKIKTFHNEGSEKIVGFWVTDENGQQLAIDKRVALVDGKSNEDYITEALALCENQIAEWQASFAIIGKIFDPESQTLAISSENDTNTLSDGLS